MPVVYMGEETSSQAATLRCPITRASEFLESVSPSPTDDIIVTLLQGMLCLQPFHNLSGHAPFLVIGPGAPFCSRGDPQLCYSDWDPGFSTSVSHDCSFSRFK